MDCSVSAGARSPWDCAAGRLGDDRGSPVHARIVDRRRGIASRTDDGGRRVRGGRPNGCHPRRPARGRPQSDGGRSAGMVAHIGAVAAVSTDIAIGGGMVSLLIRDNERRCIAVSPAPVRRPLRRAPGGPRPSTPRSPRTNWGPMKPMSRATRPGRSLRQLADQDHSRTGLSIDPVSTRPEVLYRRNGRQAARDLNLRPFASRRCTIRAQTFRPGPSPY